MTRLPRRGRGFFYGSYPDWEERAEVLRLRNQGLTFRQIGAALGVSHQAAHQMFWRALRDLNRPARGRGHARW